MILSKYYCDICMRLFNKEDYDTKETILININKHIYFGSRPIQYIHDIKNIVRFANHVKIKLKKCLNRLGNDDN